MTQVKPVPKKDIIWYKHINAFEYFNKVMENLVISLKT